MTETGQKKRHQIHVTRTDSACGYVGHMTVDELKEVTVGSDFDASCPTCGQIHLTRDEIEEIESQKVTDSQEYKNTTKEAEAS
jgi:Zn-finger nucleic acid-binding protein